MFRSLVFHTFCQRVTCIVYRWGGCLDGEVLPVGVTFNFSGSFFPTVCDSAGITAFEIAGLDELGGNGFAFEDAGYFVLEGTSVK